MCALHATVLSSSGPARKYTAKFEPAAWSRAQMTSGFGAPKRIRAHNAHAGVSVSRSIKSGNAPNTRTVTIVRA
eukprot:scaffold3945_cov70-Phaeocystis_antarctica.AAC.4